LTVRSGPRALPTPPLWLSLFVVLSGALAGVAVTRGHFDPDFFWHLATGRQILESGAIPSTDPFSFTWAGRPWIPDQWLGDLLIAWVVDVSGDAGVLLLFGAVAAGGLALVAAAVGRNGRGPSTTAAVATLVGATLLPQVTARPQVLSFALAGLVLAILISVREDTAKRLYWLPPILLVWANVHGYFIVGLAIIAVYGLSTLLGQTPLRDRQGLVATTALLCIGATMLTPQGPAGVLYAVSFLDARDFGARAIVEWQSPDFHSPEFLTFLLLIGVTLLAGIQRAPAWTRVVAVGGILAGLFAVRAIGIGAVLVMPALLLSRPSIGALNALPAADRAGRAWLDFSAAAAVAVVVVVAAMGRGPVTVDERRVPRAGVEVLAQLRPAAHVLTDYSWGGYAISELYEAGGRVFVDGRMHKYAPDVMADYLRIVDAGPDWAGLADRYGVDAILLPPSEALVRGAAQDAGWCELLRDPRQVLLLRQCPSNGSVAGGSRGEGSTRSYP
jgi:hypothetical protein